MGVRRGEAGYEFDQLCLALARAQADYDEARDAEIRAESARMDAANRKRDAAEALELYWGKRVEHYREKMS